MLFSKQQKTASPAYDSDLWEYNWTMDTNKTVEEQVLRDTQGLKQGPKLEELKVLFHSSPLHIKRNL
jgi:hypothetical protein